MNETDRIEAGIVALEGQRDQLGDSVVDTALASLRLRLAALRGEELQQQLRQVTVLFADIVGSTALSETLEPEDIHAIVNGAMERFTAIVQAQRGRVLQYAGDSLLAVFGADGGQEDDPERALHVGLALLQEAARLGEQVRLQRGFDGFNLRVGIHTGAVLLGGGVDAAGSIRGAAVNVAARMEQTAPVGRMRISHDTYRQVRGVFDVEPQPPLELKGVAEPMVTYLVVRAKPRAFRVAQRGVDGIETRMVGRDAEFSRLISDFESAVNHRTLARITLVAEAGLGKSRLMFEFEHWLEMRPEQILLFQGRAHPQGIHQPYGVLRDMLCWRFQIQDSDSFDEAHRKMLVGFGPVLAGRAQEVTALVGQLIGLDYHASQHIAGIVQDGKQIRDRAFHALSQFFGLLCAEPSERIVLMLDDLHWADAGSLDFIDYLASSAANLPLLVVCATRPSLYERRPLWGADQGRHARIDLVALPRGESRVLAEALLSRIEDPPAMLRELIIGNAEGNPFYMEELTQMLIDDGAIVVGAPHWRLVTEKLLKLHLPATLTGVLQARLDALQPHERAALLPASVIGHVFWEEALANLGSQAVPALPALVQRDLTRRHDTTAFEGTTEYAFKHHALHQVAYDSVLKRPKRDAHRLTAEWLITRSGERLGEYESLIASHFEGAGESARAAHHWRQAAEHALRRFALDAALAHADRGLSLSPSTDLARRYALTLVRCEVFARTQAREPHALALDELERLADDLLDDLRRSQAAERRAGFLITGGEFGLALPFASMSLERAAGRDPVLEARAHNAMTLATARLGQYAVAMNHAQLGLALARESGDKTAHANLLQNMGMVLLETGDPVGAAACYEQALVLCRHCGDRFGECRVLNSLSDICRSMGDYASASRRMLELISLCQHVGVRIFEGYAHLNLALVMVNLGQPAIGLAHARTARRILCEVGDRWAEGCALVNAGHAHLALGELALAATQYRAANEAFDDLTAAQMMLQAMAGLAAVSLAEGDTRAALARVEDILARLSGGTSLDGTDEPLRVRLTCLRTLEAVSDARATGVLALAHGELSARADKISDARARAEFLSAVPHHREIIAAWAAREPG